MSEEEVFHYMSNDCQVKFDELTLVSFKIAPNKMYMTRLGFGILTYQNSRNDEKRDKTTKISPTPKWVMIRC